MSDQRNETALPLRANEYRDLLEAWTAWWNNVGRQHYTYNLLPPLTKTADALGCTACHDVGPVEAAESPSGRCEVCHRRMT